jgi:hypothetical protein
MSAKKIKEINSSDRSPFKSETKMDQLVFKKRINNKIIELVENSPDCKEN